MKSPTIDKLRKLNKPRTELAKAVFFLCFIFAASALSCAQSLDCSKATVVTAADLTTPQASALEMLLDETAKRTGSRWPVAHQFPRTAAPCVLVAATRSQMPALLPPVLAAARLDTPDKPEAFSLHAFRYHSRAVILITGNDDRGLLFGIGALLRKLSLSVGQATLPGPLHLMEFPEKPVRSHQLGYRFKNNTYDAWNLAQFEQYIRDLAIFGANTVQMISPESDDAPASPLFPAPALETLLGVSKLLDKYGLNCDIYYPEMEKDYANPADMARELSRFETLFRQIPRVDALWIPGGDPGHTPPSLLFPLVEQEVAILRKYHPRAKVYISAQGMDAARYEDFYRLVAARPAWLSGIFFGPQSRDSFETQRRRIPAELPLLFYPDIGHAMHAQFPVPQWDPVFALTEGREPINPRPQDQALIYRRYAPLNIGFVTYSEGVNDDVNKMLWNQWAWSAETPAESILEDYARFFIGPQFAAGLAKGIADLEQDWRGPLLSNRQIPKTLQEFQQIADSPQAPKDNWRLEMALYRANYDSFVQTRLQAETAQQVALASLGNHTALDAMGRGIDPEKTMELAENLLKPPAVTPGAAQRRQVFALADKLFHHIGLQLSVKLYGASNWERGANLDRIDIPLNDRVWYAQQFARIRALPAGERRAALQAIEPPVDGFYDDLGNPWNEPHLVRGPGYAADPEFYQSANDGVADRTPDDGWRWSQLTYAETLYETPLHLHYDGLNTTGSYKVRVTYGGEDYALPLRLTANHSIEIHPPLLRKTNPQTLEFDIPAEATRSGSLDLEWTGPPNSGGSGRGRQVAEVWLLP